MTAASENEHITGLWFVNQKYYPNGTQQWVNEPDFVIFTDLKRWLNAYFEGKASGVPTAEFKLNPYGTTFQKAVWDKLLQIPYGKTMTYGEIAESMARQRELSSMSAQAVGGAVGHNPISILIPCHRVVGSNGSLTGYAGGLDKKETLLKLEGITLK